MTWPLHLIINTCRLIQQALANAIAHILSSSLNRT